MKTGLEHIILPPRPARQGSAKQRDDERNVPRRSPRAHINFIPSTSELEELIARARQALARGMIWDRGAIINLVL